MTVNYKASVRRAKRFQVKASIMIEGLTGNGKTGLALCIAHTLVGKSWEKIGMVDTENKSADLMVGQHLHIGEPCGEFLKVDLTAEEGYAPLNYRAAEMALKNEGVECIIHDSSTHAWNRQGGILDLVNRVEERGNKFAAWRDPIVVKNKDALFELLRSPLHHVITTVRVKEKFDLQQDESTGKSRVVSLGEQQIQTEGLKYEPDLVLSMVAAGTTDTPPLARVIKSRYPMLIRDETYAFTPSLIEQIRIFLEEGADPAELIAAQHTEYEEAVKEFCEARPNQKNVWSMIKDANGFKDKKIKDIPLKDLKSMYMQLTAETEA
jgi:DNA polymerase III delta prime subunit